MANKKISELSATTQANDNVFLVMNNSGNTETFRIKRSDLLSGTSSPAGFIQGDASQSLVPYYFPTSSGTTSGTTYVDKLNVVGQDISAKNTKLEINTNNNTFTSNGTYNTIIGGINHQLLNDSADNNVILGGNGNDILGNLDNSLILGGANNTINNGTTTSIIGSNNSELRGSFSTLIAGENSSILSANSERNGIFGAKSSSITGNFVQYTTLVGGSGVNIKSFEPTHRVKGIIVGARTTNITTTTNGNGATSYPVVLGGENNNIYSDTLHLFPTLIGGTGNTITDSDKTTLINSFNVDVNGVDNTHFIGITDYTGTTANTLNNTTYVDNSHTLRTETFDTISGGSVSGVVSVDLSQGTLYKFSITGNITSVDFINWREGQRAEFIVENTGSYTISAMTISGGGSVYVQGGSVNPTNNAFTKYRGVIVDGDMFLNEELNFQPFV